MDAKSTFLSALLFTSLSAVAQLGPLDSGMVAARPGTERQLELQFQGLRTRGTSAAKEVQVGAYNLGSSALRSEADLTYARTVNFTLQYNRRSNYLEVQGFAGSETGKVRKSNISEAVASAGNSRPLMSLNFLELRLQTNTPNTRITVTNLRLDGEPIQGTYVKASTGTGIWNLTDVDFATNTYMGFVLTGTIMLSGPFADDPAANLVEVIFGSRPEAIPNPLPVVWGNVSVKKNGNGRNLLQWTTLEEENADRYLVQRSEDGRTFRPIGQVTARGNSSVASHYSFEDPAAGDAYYRLIQIDADGKFAYSRIVSIKGGNKTSVVYDGVATVRIQTPAPRNVQLYDINGRMHVNTRIQNGVGSIDVGSLPRGVYLVQVEGESGATRFVKN